MSKRARRSKSNVSLPAVNPHAAGIDIGAREVYVAVPLDSNPDPVRSFTTFTDDLHDIASWLAKCGVKTVAMESTGVYWIPIFQILESAGLEVFLVNSRHVKNVPGRKTDVCDAQWLQYLHSVGLLRPSFRPPQEVCAVRSLLRHRENVVQTSSKHIQHIQKALTQMNIQIHNVITDITGVTGLRIIDAILEGERDPHKLASLRDGRIKATADTIARSLMGDYRREHLFTLSQSLNAWRYCQELIAACDIEIESMLKGFESRIDPALQPIPERSSHHKLSTAGLAIHAHVYRIVGVDLTQIPGIDTHAARTLFCEIGAIMDRFPSASHFASWLGLCPDNRITGGRILSAKTRDVGSRAAGILRMAANSLHRSQTSLGEFFRRMKARLGVPKAITATAHKLARIIFHLIRDGTAYDDSVFAQQDERHRQRKLRYLTKQAAEFGCSLIPNTEEQPQVS